MFIYHFNRLIRSRILWGFFAIIISIAFVAVGSCFKLPQEGMVAGKINGKRITTDTFDQVVMAVRGFGRNRDNETSARVVDRRAWEQIAAVQTLQQTGLGASSEEVREALQSVPAFQGPNGFDLQRYRMVLMEQGLSPTVYERLTKHQISMMKAALMVDSASWVSPMEMQDELAAMTDRFTVQTATVNNRFSATEMRLSAADYKKFYDENTASFGLPDRVSVRYLAIPVSNYFSRVTVPEGDLQEYYDSHVDSYKRTGTNNVSQTIPFAEVRAKIHAELLLEEARYCAETNVTFTVFGKQAKNGNALDRLAAQMGGAVKTTALFGAEETLPFVENSKAFASAAFELDADREESRLGVVKGDKKIYVIELKERSAAHVPTFEAIQADVKARAQAKARTEAFQSYVKELRADLRKLLDEGKSFTEAAKSKALNVSTSITYTASEIQGKPFENSFAVAYGAMTLKKKELSDVIPASPTQSLLVYVQDRQPGDALAAEMMRSQVRASVARRRDSNLLEAWMKWNLDQQKFEPVRTYSEEDEADDPPALNTAKKEKSK